MTVEIFAEAPHAVWLEYDSSDRSVQVVPDRPGAFKRTPSVVIAPSGDWVQCRFEIDDGRFCRAVNGADFRLASDLPAELPLRIRRCAVAPLAADLSRTTVAAARVAAALAFPAATDPAVSVIVPVFNRLELTLQCLTALRANTGAGYEVLVVDDGSSDGTAEALRAIRGLRVLEHGANRGFAAACNAGAAAARGRYLLFLNNDTVPQGGWLESMVAAAESDRTIGIVGAKLLFPETGEIQHAGVEFTAEGVPVHRLELAAADDPAVCRSRPVPAVTGACLLIRRIVFERCGGFDERFRNGYEDIDLCLRVREAGHEVLYCASSVLLHHACVSDGRWTHEAANRTLFLSRWKERLGALTAIRATDGRGADRAPLRG
ncbi:MAG: glycosyltransferase family 2 protein [Deltaproteobacteria bacterium]|nr:glycosyltransferase family 2 protein [Deltaproteobacteria bacterium]